MSGLGAHAAATLVLLAVPATASAATNATPWTFAGTGASGRAVSISAQFGGCDHLSTPVVVESASSVRITARVALPDPPPAVCPEIAGFGKQVVHLKAALAGRRLLGGTSGAAPLAPGAALPRVVGLAPADAVAALRARHATAVLVRRGGGAGRVRVLSQRGARLAVGRAGAHG